MKNILQYFEKTCDRFPDHIAAADAHTFRYFSTERYHAGYCSYGNRFIPLSSQHLSAGFNHLLERCRFNNAHLYTGCFSFRFRKNDFITVGFGSFVVFIGCFMIVFSATFAFMGMIGSFCLVIMSFRGMIVFIVCVTVLLLQDPSTNKPRIPTKISFFIMIFSY